jgi:hypothetical protein
MLTSLRNGIRAAVVPPNAPNAPKIDCFEKADRLVLLGFFSLTAVPLNPSIDLSVNERILAED